MTYPPPYPHPDVSVRRWWQHPALIIALLILVPPGGIALAWTSRWSKGKKLIATVLAGLWFLSAFLGDPPKKTETDAKPKVATGKSTAPATTPSPNPLPNYVGQNLKQAKTDAYAAGYNAISHDAGPGSAGQWNDDNWKVCFQAPVGEPAGTKATLDFGVVRNEWPCPAKDGEPIPYPKMPKVVGLTFAKASEILKPIGLQEIEPRSAYTDVTLPATVDDWTVCFQEPEDGEEIQRPKTTTAYLEVAGPGTGCPTAQHTKLHPDPTPPSNDDDSSSSSTSGGTSRSGGTSSGGTSSSGGGGQTGVGFGRFCSPVGARATTGDGRPAKCFMGKDGRARWGYAS
ncbi:hypothetical protein ACGFNX_05620 [Streptomyces sp. NPDC048723]|uniref:hypothetical protein n=1 Tax=Streptomyces sp. NPDC048723 TaxID=3365589 RepID=UPI00371423A8